MRAVPLTKLLLRGLSFSTLLACTQSSAAAPPKPRAETSAERSKTSRAKSERRIPSGEAKKEAEPSSALSDSFALEARGDLRGALRAGATAADERPERYFPRLRVAFLELSLKDYAAAARDYARAAALAPKAIEPLLGQQQALVLLARYKDAEPLGRELLNRDPHSYLASSRHAWTLYNLKRYDAAARLYFEILTLYPGDVEMMVGLGYSQLYAGRKRDAAQTFRQILDMVPRQPRALSGLAACR